jgi:hypothetical protein
MFELNNVDIMGPSPLRLYVDTLVALPPGERAAAEAHPDVQPLLDALADELETGLSVRRDASVVSGLM